MAQEEAAALANQSIKRFVDPAHIAALVVFLSSGAGRSISGQLLPIDGDSQSASWTRCGGAKASGIGRDIGLFVVNHAFERTGLAAQAVTWLAGHGGDAAAGGLDRQPDRG